MGIKTELMIMSIFWSDCRNIWHRVWPLYIQEVTYHISCQLSFSFDGFNYNLEYIAGSLVNKLLKTQRELGGENTLHLKGSKSSVGVALL